MRPWSFIGGSEEVRPDVKFISQFNSVQVFWDQFRARPVSELPDKTYLHVFKNDIKPLWEDPSNYCGGHFKLTARSQAQSEKMWMVVLLNMLGEQFPFTDFVNGASVMSNQVGNNLVKVWLATTEKSKVQAVREFLRTILDAEDYMSNVTFVPHKLVVKGAGKKITNITTEAPPHTMAAKPQQAPPEASLLGFFAGDTDFPTFKVTPETPSTRKRVSHLVITAPEQRSPGATSPVPPSPESTRSIGRFSFGGLSDLPSSMPPSPPPISPTASYTGSEWEADCGLTGIRLMPPGPVFPVHHFSRQPKPRSLSTSSQESYTYTHNPYSLANAVIYSAI